MSYSMDSPFMEELRQEAETIANGGQVMTVNGSPMGRAIWNPIVSKRDISNYVRIRGMKPHRYWKVTDVKKYFGIKGSGETLLNNFMHLYNDIMGAIEGEE